MVNSVRISLRLSIMSITSDPISEKEATINTNIVAAKNDFAHAALAVGLLIGAVFLAKALKEFMETIQKPYFDRYRFGEGVLLDKKAMRCYYQQYEKKSLSMQSRICR